MAKRKPQKGKQAKRTAARVSKPKTARPRQTRLPGTEDGFIREIEDAAAEYVEGRDERMDATTREVELKGSLIAAMHRHHKTHYRRGDLEIVLTVEKEKVTVRKVRVKDDDADVTVSNGKTDDEPFNAPDPEHVIDDEVSNL